MIQRDYARLASKHCALRCIADFELIMIKPENWALHGTTLRTSQLSSEPVVLGIAPRGGLEANVAMPYLFLFIFQFLNVSTVYQGTQILTQAIFDRFPSKCRRFLLSRQSLLRKGAMCQRRHAQCSHV